jgi:hypothetical protein
MVATLWCLDLDLWLNPACPYRLGIFGGVSLVKLKV